MARADAGTIARRPAFTLVELLVVFLIIAILAGIGVAFLTAFNGPATAAQGATIVQSTMTIARSEALRGRRPYGVRLIVDPKNPGSGLVTELQFIEQPDDYFGGRVRTPTNTSGTPILNQVQFLDVDLTGGFGIAAVNRPKWPVQVGDYIEFHGSGLVHRIKTIAAKNLIVLESPLKYPLVVNTATTPKTVNQFRIIRAPRVVAAEPVLLPSDTAIDLNTNTLFGNPLPTSYDGANVHDIMFSANGGLIGRGTTDTPIFLWVRNTTETSTITSGDPTLIAIYSRTGATAAHPVFTPGISGPSPNPYKYARDGRSSGL